MPRQYFIDDTQVNRYTFFIALSESLREDDKFYEEYKKMLLPFLEIDDEEKEAGLWAYSESQAEKMIDAWGIVEPLKVGHNEFTIIE